MNRGPARPYSYGRAMTRTQTMVQLTEELIESLDALAARRSVSRSALIREFVLEGLQQSTASALGERIADGYRRIPQAQPDEWGDLAAASDIAAGELMARLDAEERAAGHEPGGDAGGAGGTRA